jgi:hypothetical protein
LTCSTLEETRNSFFWGKGGLLKPAAPYFVHDFFQPSEKGGEQSVSPQKTRLHHKPAQTGTNRHKPAQTGTNRHKPAQIFVLAQI